jgi:hypothetical protein
VSLQRKNLFLNFFQTAQLYLIALENRYDFSNDMNFSSNTAHWSGNVRARFVLCLVPSQRPPKFAHFRSCSKCVRFVHSFPFPLQKKHCDSVKASWTKRQCSSSRRPASGTSGRSRLGPASFQSHTGVQEKRRLIRQFDRSRGPVVTLDMFVMVFLKFRCTYN